MSRNQTPGPSGSNAAAAGTAGSHQCPRVNKITTTTAPANAPRPAKIGPADCPAARRAASAPMKPSVAAQTVNAAGHCNFGIQVGSDVCTLVNPQYAAKVPANPPDNCISQKATEPD